MKEKEIYEVIINTIKFDNFIKDEIGISIGLIAKFKENKNRELIFVNNKEMQKFDIIYEELGSSKKLKILNEIINDKGIKKLNDFDNLFRDLYNIRNIFAHSLLPKQYSKEEEKVMPQPNWKDLYNKHKEIYEKLMKWFFKDFIKIEANVIF